MLKQTVSKSALFFILNGDDVMMVISQKCQNSSLSLAIFQLRLLLFLHVIIKKESIYD